MTLARSRFTCKGWNALVKDPSFIKKHLGKAARQSLVVTRMRGDVYSMNLSLHGIHNNVDPFTEFTSKLRLTDPHRNLQVYIREAFHCDGLFLCTASIQEKLVVLNPCTGQTMWLTPFDCSDIYALGYDQNNNYKILRCARDFTGRMEIFGFCSNSWRVSDDDLHHKYALRSSGLSLKGHTYWTTRVLNSSRLFAYSLLKFDFPTERFCCLSLPGGDQGFYSRSLAVVGEDQLSAMYWSSYIQKMEIWVSTKIETNNVSWSKFLKLDLLNIADLGVSSEESFFMDYDKKFVVFSYYSRIHEGIPRNCVYIVGDQEEGKFREISLGEEEKNLLSLPSFNCVPSLVRF